jgi:O-acetyl-ADP-ribose deacetylase (regulator of RNase III)
MKIEYVKGNLFEGSESVVVHGCNAQGKFASGFAGVVRERHPFAYDAYMTTAKNSKLILGSIIWASEGNLSIANAITQEHYGRDGKQYVSYDAIRLVMETINLTAQDGIPFSANRNGFDRIAMPLIGASLGGGDWNVISEIIEKACTHVQPVVYYLETLPIRN